MTENNDKTVFDEAFLTDRIRIVGADYLLCNILVIFGGGAAAAAALRLGSKGTDLAAVFLYSYFIPCLPVHLLLYH